MTKYNVEVKTGTLENAGTDAHVYIQLIGAKASSTVVRIDNGEDNFENGKLDHFQIDVEDVGWIDAIRIFHDNENKKPGWYVDWVSVTRVDLGLCFKAPFNRWLAKTTGDGQVDVTMKVPVGNVSLQHGQIVSYFMGYDAKRRRNDGPSPMTYKEAFTYTHKQGMTLKKGTSTTISAGMKIGAEFWGLKSEFSISASTTIVSELSTTEEQTLTFTSEWQVTLDPGEAVTVIACYFQNVLEGEVQANGVRMQFEDKFAIDCDLLTFDGMLSDDEVAQKVREYLKAMMASGTPPATIAKKDALIVLSKQWVVGSMNAASIKPMLKASPRIQPSMLSHGASLVSNASILKSFDHTVSHK